MKRKSSLVKFILVLVATAIGLVASFVSFSFNTIGGNVWNYNGFVHAIDLGLDLEGGVYAVYEASGETPDDASMNGTVTQLTDMLTNQGYTEATVVREGTSRIRVEVPDVDDPEEIFNIIGDPAELAFYHSEDASLSSDDEFLFSGDVVTNAVAAVSDNQYVVNLTLNGQGAQIFANATSAHAGDGTFILICETHGDDSATVISAATITQAITNGQAMITGGFTAKSAQTLADRIKSGTFSVPLSLIDCPVVDPTLGSNALIAGLIGGIVAILLIMVFMSVFYKMMGMVACVTMLTYSVLMLFLLAVFPLVQLSLPGIAGIILSLGMMIDGNVIIYERIKDEYRNGKSILAAYHAGFRKAVSAIVDGNVTTIIAAVMLLIFGTGTISGFGVTLLIGLVLSMFASLVLTRFLLKWTIAIFGDKDPGLYGLKRRPGFDEANEEQYIPKPRREKKRKAVVMPNGIAVEVDPDEVAQDEAEAEKQESVPQKNSAEKANSAENFDDIFGSFDGGDKK